MVAPPPWCLDRRGRRRRSPPLLLPSRVGRGWDAKVRRPFFRLPAAPAAPVAGERVPGRSPPDWVPPPLWVGGLPVSALEALADYWSRVLGAGRPEGWLPYPLQGLSSSPRLPGGREDVVQGRLENRPRSGSRLLQSSFPGGKGDGVIDLSHLNEFVLQTLFKMETVASMLLSIREGDFLAFVDLKDTYFQIPVHQSSRKLLRFLSGGTVCQFKALCFGLSTAPRVFAAVSAWAHSHVIHLRYLDN